MQKFLNDNIAQLQLLLPKVAELGPAVEALGNALLSCWERRGKVLIAGNGGSMADAMHFAEELVVRFVKNRRALAAIALSDSTVLTCTANDFGYERVFSRQVEALGNPGDWLIVMSTSGNSPNLIRAVEEAKKNQMHTAAFLGKGGGSLAGQCEIEMIVPSSETARIQEIHKLLFHTLCQWVDSHID